MRLSLFLIFLSLLPFTGLAQLLSGGSVMHGTVTDAGTGLPLDGVSVSNTTQNANAYSDENGHYTIAAASGDLVAFSHLGFKSIVVTAVTAGSRDVPLNRKTQYLPETIVRPKWTPYQADSIARARTYQRPLARQKSGGVMSPVTFLAEKLNKRSKQIYRFQKEFHEMEDQRYVESRYTPELVTTLTGLTGDSVARFINANPMPPEYARAVGDLELKVWIRQTYREWIAKVTAAAPTDSAAVRN